MSDISQVEKNGRKFNLISFNQAYHENFVHSYKLKFSQNGNDKEFWYFSDFFLMPEDRKKDITLKLNDKLKGQYDIEIEAYESFGNQSQPIKVKNITIPEL